MSKHATEFDISVIARLAGLDLNKQELAAAQKDICDMLTLADTLDIMEPIPAVSNFSGTSCTLEDITPTSDDLLSFLNTVSPNEVVELYAGKDIPIICCNKLLIFCTEASIISDVC